MSYAQRNKGVSLHAAAYFIANSHIKTCPKTLKAWTPETLAGTIRVGQTSLHNDSYQIVVYDRHAHAVAELATQREFDDLR
jgi:hypothetical protein